MSPNEARSDEDVHALTPEEPQERSNGVATGSEGQDFGTGGKGVAPNERAQFWCSHPRFSVLSKEKLKDRIVVLQLCRRCSKVRTMTIYRDENARNIFVRRRISNIPYIDDVPEEAPTIAPKPMSIDEETGSD